MAEINDIMELVRGYREECVSGVVAGKKEKKPKEKKVKATKKKNVNTFCDEFGHLIFKKIEYAEDMKELANKAYDEENQITFDKKAFTMEYKGWGYPIPARDITYKVCSVGEELSACKIASEHFGKDFAEAVKRGEAIVLKIYTNESVPINMTVAGEAIIYKTDSGRMAYKFSENKIFSNRGIWKEKKNPRDLLEKIMVSTVVKGE